MHNKLFTWRTCKAPTLSKYLADFSGKYLHAWRPNARIDVSAWEITATERSLRKTWMHRSFSATRYRKHVSEWNNANIKLNYSGFWLWSEIFTTCRHSDFNCMYRVLRCIYYARYRTKKKNSWIRTSRKLDGKCAPTPSVFTMGAYRQWIIKLLKNGNTY